MPSQTPIRHVLSKAQTRELTRIIEGRVEIRATIERFGSHLRLRFSDPCGNEISGHVIDRLVWMGYLQPGVEGLPVVPSPIAHNWYTTRKPSAA